MRNENKMRKCLLCGKHYADYPATSRRDNRMQICPDCGLKEAMDDSGIDSDEQKKILDAVHEFSGKCDFGMKKEGGEADRK